MYATAHPLRRSLVTTHDCLHAVPCVHHGIKLPCRRCRRRHDFDAVGRMLTQATQYVIVAIL
eukprot:198211-Pyramimonas_sp.AAC.2